MIREAFGGSALSYSQISKLLKFSKEGREKVHDEQHFERSLISKTENNVARFGQLLDSES